VAVHALSALLAGIVTLALGFSVMLREHRTRAQSRLATLSYLLAAWHIGSFLHLSLNLPLLKWFATLPAVAIPAVALSFFAAFLAKHPYSVERLPRPLLISTLVLYAALAVALIFRLDHLVSYFSAWVTAHVFGGLAYVVWFIARRRKESESQVERTRLLYILVGAAACVAFSFADFIPGLQTGGRVLSNVFVVIYIYFLVQALSRYRLLDINDIIGRIIVTTVLVATLTAFYVLLLVWIGKDQLGIFFFTTLVASFVVLLLLDPLRHALEEAVNRVIFRQTSELRRRLERLKWDLASVIEMKEAVSLLLARLEATDRVTDCGIYLIDSDGSAYELRGSFGAPKPARIDTVRYRAFLERLRRDGVLTLEGLERELAARTVATRDAEREQLEGLLETLGSLTTSLCLGLIAEEMLVGFICLRDERLREAYSSDEIDLFRQVAVQAAVTLENSKLTERIKERERLAAIGEMAAGLAHEIRNPLGAIKGAAQILASHKGRVSQDDGPTAHSTYDEGLRIIVDEVNRLNNVVSQFLDYARPYKGDQRLLDIREVLKGTALLLKAEPLAANVTIEMDLTQELP